MDKIDTQKVLAALSYFYFFSFIILMLADEDDFLEFHARLGLAVFVMALGVWFVGWLSPLRSISNIGQLAIIAVMVFGAWQALLGRKTRIPIASQIADRFFF